MAPREILEIEDIPSEQKWDIESLYENGLDIEITMGNLIPLMKSND